MTNLLELAERCEKATGPNRSLDVEICVATCTVDSSVNPQYVQNMRPDDDDDGWVLYEYEDENYTDCAASFTESIDAAMKLVPEGLDWRVDTMTGLPGAIVCLPNAWLSHKTAPRMVHGKTPALALAAAALRARASAVTSKED